MLRVKNVALLVLVGLACGKDSAGPGSTSSGTLVLSPPAVGFNATEDGPNPAAVPIAISNGASGRLSGIRTTVTYPPNQPAGWLAASLSDTATPSTLTLSATTGTLRLGIHTAFVTVTADGATNGPQIFEVPFLVTTNAIFVSANDPSAVNDAACGLGPIGWGTGFHPCLTIAQGLNRAVQIARPKVVVADGLYPESVTLLNGVSVLGGYQPETWERHLTTTSTVILGAATIPATGHEFAVRATGITAATVFEGFVVRGPINGTSSGNSYTIYVSNSTANLTIRNNVILGGRGGPGAPGAVGANGVLGAVGGDRSGNSLAYDAFITTGTGSCDVANNRQLINGGARTVGADDISGGRGGGNSCPVSTIRTRVSAQVSVSGQAGAGAGGGTSGAAGVGGFDGTDSLTVSIGEICVLPSSPMDGTNGTAGGAGAHGAVAAGGSNATDSVVGGHWTGSPGATGNAGANGGGGGGGGAGGGAICKSCAAAKDRLGGHGGGGGSGGAGGGAGGSGGSGGGAFGLFVVGTAAPTVSSNVIVRGDGGIGGSGGNAGAGGLGGTGGAGGVAIFCTGSGGRGGDGGAGGHGSGGGGGSGGASYGIYTSGAGSLTYCDAGSSNVMSGGSGGPGGSGGGSLINPGGTGQAGTLATCSFH